MAKNNEGYSDICRIITQRKLNEDFSIFKIIKQTWENLFLITPDIDILKESNKTNSVYAEIIPTSPNKRNALKTFQFAKEIRIPVVASNPIYFLKKEEIKDEFKAKGLKQAKEELNILKLSESDRKEYEHFIEQVRYEESLIVSNYKVGKLEVAKELKKSGVAIEIIIKTTGFSREEIEKL